MAAVPPNWVFKVTKVDLPENVGLPHSNGKVACIEMPYSGNNEKKYINEPFEQTLNTIINNIVTTERSIQPNVDYYQAGTDEYYIYEDHPNMLMFDNLWEHGKSKVLSGGSRRRRRPSRKYKKSKRVLRRKSRSTRRR
jgi:hypothetical protein